MSITAYKEELSINCKSISYPLKELTHRTIIGGLMATRINVCYLQSFMGLLDYCR